MILGIDPGFKGGLAWNIDGTRWVEPFDMPTIGAGRTTEVDLDSMSGYVLDQKDCSPTDCTCYLEWPSARTGENAQTSLRFGIGIGMLYGYLIGSMKIVRVAPQTWKRVLGLPGKQKDPKSEVSAKYCEDVLGIPPQWIRGPRGGIKDGKIDAILIAHYGYLQEYT